MRSTPRWPLLLAAGLICSPHLLPAANGQTSSTQVPLAAPSSTTQPGDASPPSGAAAAPAQARGRIVEMPADGVLRSSTGEPLQFLPMRGADEAPPPGTTPIRVPDAATAAPVSPAAAPAVPSSPVSVTPSAPVTAVPAAPSAAPMPAAAPVPAPAIGTIVRPAADGVMRSSTGEPLQFLPMRGADEPAPGNAPTSPAPAPGGASGSISVSPGMAPAQASGAAPAPPRSGSSGTIVQTPADGVMRSSTGEPLQFLPVRGANEPAQGAAASAPAAAASAGSAPAPAPAAAPAATGTEPSASATRPAPAARPAARQIDPRTDEGPIVRPPVESGDSWTYRRSNGRGNVLMRQTVLRASPDGLALRTEVAGSPDSTTALYNRDWALQASGYNDYRPALSYYAFPLYRNKRWSINSAVSNFGAGLTGSVKGEAWATDWEQVQVPAGKFLALRVEIDMETVDPSDPSRTVRVRETHWYARTVMRAVKVESHSVVGDQAPTSETVELVSYRMD